MSARHASIPEVQDAWPTWRQVADTLTFSAGYNTSVVLAGAALLGVAAGIVGAFALLRKRSLVADALSHATLPGIALAYLAATALGYAGKSTPILLLGATITGVLGVVSIQLLLRHTRLKEDAAIGLVLSIFFGAGAVLMSVIQSLPRGDAAGLQGYIFAQAAVMTGADAQLMGVIAVVAAVTAALLIKEFGLVCFDDQFARVQGWGVQTLDLAMLSLIVLVTVAGLQAVGLILVVALLIVPAVSARFWTERLHRLVILSGLIGGLSGYLGAATSALLPRKPAGAVIVLTAGAIFFVSLMLAPSRGVLAATIRRAKVRVRIAADHLLEAGFLHQHEGGAPRLHAEGVREVAQHRGWGPLMHAALRLHAIRTRLGRFEAGAFLLTPKGVERGRRVARNHRLWEQYLVTHAELAPSHIDWTVDQVEHVLSEDLVAQLESLLGDAAIPASGAARAAGAPG
ncbi:MAG: iron chelate uptake ABC transporter family permease subunit [Planctomycetota bacterium]